MIKYLEKVFYVLNIKKTKLVLILLTVTGASVLEAMGIRLISPFIIVASQPEFITKISWLYWIYQKSGIRDDNYWITILGCVFMLVLFINSTLYILSQNYINKFYNHQKTRLILRLLKGYLKLPYTFHLSKNSADIVKNIVFEVSHFSQQCMAPLLNSVSNLVVVLVLGILLARTNRLLLSLILTILLPVLIFCYYIWGKIRRWGEIQSKSKQEMMLILNHSLGSLKETQVIGCESYFEQQLLQPTHNLEQATTFFQNYQILPKIFIEITLILSIIIFIAISKIFWNQNIAELNSTLGIFALSALRIIPAASSLISSINYLQNSHYALETIYNDLNQIDKVSHSQKFDNLTHENQVMYFHNQLELSQINYCYPDTSELVLRDISLTINKGESIAIIGKSGAGKTTLVDVILGILKPEKGEIMVDGISIYQNLRAWQNIIGYVPQSIFLMDDTIEHNIAFGIEKEQIDLERLYQSIEMSQLTEMIAQLPQGIKTLVGERGVRLSGGQRQRIGIARVLYHQRKILVFDEATSALDNETEKSVNQAIQALSGQVTMIIVAHRLTTITHCDRLYVLDQENHTISEA
ncbi:ABC transporter ATP-binding protein [Anabaena sp. UHCC 0451]|uniref:ABC transporter ATP-binding protein n=1 Tax=Anabaena sp. UHCC 0451 TaxID=2055235 RepID=UPI002B1FAFC8|nr:ATP-binding cassette domain-containing protein [Anabaena sp. UHCC 0451]MEA5577334.1 ATP-binding cassette domain-containing protein [Anabaena sp. UHCC 0451]